MKRVLPFAIALVIIFAFWVRTPAEPTESGGTEWLTDMDRAMQQAQSADKDLLLNFTGSDWCSICRQLKGEIFSQPEFVKATEDFVLVELDFPKDESIVPPDTRKQNEKWHEKLVVEHFPTIMLADAQGRPFAMTGYRPGGVAPFMTQLAELRRIREIRDDALAAAEAAEGLARAQHLHAALSAMNGNFVIPNYRTEVQQIIALDAQNEAGLREPYRLALAESDAHLKVMQIADRAGKAASEEGREAAANLVREELTKAANDDLLRNKIQMLRLEMLPLGSLPDAAGIFDELLASSHTNEAEQINLRVHRAYWLAETGKISDAAQQFDDAVARVDDSELKARLYFMKAELLEGQSMGAEAVAAYGKMIEHSAEASDNWLYGHKRLGDLLVELGQPTEALGVYDRAMGGADLELSIKINLLSGKAAAQLASGNRGAAIATARSAKQLAAALRVEDVEDFWLNEAEQRINAVLKEAGGSN